MGGIDQENLDTAIKLGDAVCKELGICCSKRGQVIFQIYWKLGEMKPKKDAPAEPETFETQESDRTPSLGGDKI